MRAWREAGLVFARQLGVVTREPLWIVIGLLQPLLHLLLFGPLLRPLAGCGGFPPGDPWLVLVPGLLVQLGTFGTLFAGFGVLGDMRTGVLERLRVTPASRSALLLGRVLCDVVVVLCQGVLLIVAAMVCGMRAPLVGLLVVIAIVALMATAISSLSHAVALRLNDDKALAQLLNAVVVPILLLSGILLPMSLAPSWLRTLSRVLPFSHVVDGARAAAHGQFGDLSITAGFVVAFVLAVSGIVVAVRIFTRELL